MVAKMSLSSSRLTFYLFRTPVGRYLTTMSAKSLTWTLVLSHLPKFCGYCAWNTLIGSSWVTWSWGRRGGAMKLAAPVWEDGKECWVHRVTDVSYQSLQHNGCECLLSMPFNWETLESHLWNGPLSYSREVRANSINQSFPILAINQNPLGMLPKITNAWTPPQT